MCEMKYQPVFQQVLVTELFKRIAVDYKNLDESAHKKYKLQSENASKIYKEQMEAYRASVPPEPKSAGAKEKSTLTAKDHKKVSVSFCWSTTFVDDVPHNFIVSLHVCSN